jgi:hypothetical protein
VFKGSLSLDVKNRSYLTKEVNFVFELNACLSRNAEGVNEKRQPISQLPSSLVDVTSGKSNRLIDEISTVKLLLLS